MTIIRCVSCDGFGWFDDGSGAGEDCDWCAGVGYVYRHAGRDMPIPKQDFDKVSDKLEELEHDRLREMGYQGGAKQPWRQRIRQGTRLGADPYTESDS